MITGIGDKLEVSAPGDPEEVEASRIADLITGSGLATGNGGGPGLDGRPAVPDAGPAAPGGSGGGGPGGGSGGGRPLAHATRAFFEVALGHDLGGVRIHTGDQADTAARGLGAAAMTAGHDIAFRSGRYDPDGPAGMRLLAHELAHVVQQDRRAASGERPLVQRVFDWEYDPAMRQIRQWEREEAERQRVRHGIWTRSHQERHGAELAQQATTLGAQIEKTGRSTLVLRATVFESLMAGEDLLERIGRKLGLKTVRRLPPELPAHWGAAHQAMQAVRLGVRVNDVPATTQELARDTMVGFYQSLQALAGAVEELQRFEANAARARYEQELRGWERAKEAMESMRGEPGAGAALGGWHLVHPRPQPPASAPSPFGPSLGRMLATASTAKGTAEWKQVEEDFQTATQRMDAFLIYLLPAESEARRSFEHLGLLREGLVKLQQEHPLAIRIPAIFYPKDKLIEAEGPDGRPVSVAEGIPWEFYLYHTGVRSREQPATSGGEWVLIDLTTPLRMKQNRADSSDFSAAMFQQGIVRPPRQLFEDLNTRLRFPKGRLYYRLPGDEPLDLETTEKNSLSDWLTYIGLTLAAISLVAAVVVTGGLAAPAAAPALTAIAFAAGVGAAGFSVASTLVSLQERQAHGMLTQEDINRAKLSIAIDIAGALALGMGRLVSAAGQIGVRAGMAARLAALSGRYWFIVQRTAQVTKGVALAGDVVQLMTATADFMRSYRAIQTQPGLSDTDRREALLELVGTGLFTAGLLAISIRGGVHDVKQGQNLHLIDIDPDGLIRVRPPVGPEGAGGLVRPPAKPTAVEPPKPPKPPAEVEPGKPVAGAEAAPPTPAAKPTPAEAAVELRKAELQAVKDELADIAKQRAAAGAQLRGEKGALIHQARTKKAAADRLDRQARNTRDPKRRADLEAQAEQARAEWEAARNQQIDNQEEVNRLNRNRDDALKRLQDATDNLKLAEAGRRISDTKLVTERLQGHVNRAVGRYEFGEIGPSPAQQKAAATGGPSIETARGQVLDAEAKAEILKDAELAGLKVTKQGEFGPDIYDPVTRRWWDITTPEDWAAHVKRYGEQFGTGIPLFTRAPKAPKPK